MHLVAVVLVVQLPLCHHVAVDVAALRVLDPLLQLVHVDEAVRIFVDFVHNQTACTHNQTRPDETRRDEQETDRDMCVSQRRSQIMRIMDGKCAILSANYVSRKLYGTYTHV